MIALTGATIIMQRSLEIKSTEIIMKRSILSFIIAASCVSVSNAQINDLLPVGGNVGTSSATVTEIAAPLSESYVTQWVQADEFKNVRGSVVSLVGLETVPMPRARVSLIQAGEVVLSDDTDIAGEFLLEGVPPGVYTFVAEMNGGISIYSLTVLDSVAGKHLPNFMEARLMSTNGGRVFEVLQGQSLPTSTLYAIPTQDPLAAVRKQSASHQIALDASGSIRGKLGKPTANIDMSGVTAFVFKDGIEISRSRVSSDGSFVIRDLKPGSYGFVAAGSQGVSATGFCAIAPGLAMINQNGERFVNRMAAASSLNLELGDASGTTPPPPPPEPVPSDEVFLAGPPMGAPGMGGGGSFGGGGSGGGGGFGGLGAIAGIGGLVAGISALADSGNNDAPITSPVTP